MDWIVIDGIPPYDGRYEFDIDDRAFTTREWGWIKRLSGYMPLTVDVGFDGGDPELFTVFATIALYRAGTVTDREVPDVFGRIADSPFETKIRIESDQPAEEAASGPLPESSNGNEPTSGSASPASSEASTVILPPSGMPGSATSASAPIRSET